MTGGPVPGERLAHPVVLAALALVVVNDFWLKPAFPGGIVVGKLSDIGLCVVAPVFLAAVYEWGAWAVGRVRRGGWRPAGMQVAVAACAVVGCYLAALQAIPAVADAHVAVLTALFGQRNFQVYPDLSDIAVAPVLGVAYWVLTRPRGLPEAAEHD
jgi:hypothetical protein